jgi:hypothetical protein
LFIFYCAIDYAIEKVFINLIFYTTVPVFRKANSSHWGLLDHLKNLKEIAKPWRRLQTLSANRQARQRLSIEVNLFSAFIVTSSEVFEEQRIYLYQQKF